jgi:hypothetical protein
MLRAAPLSSRPLPPLHLAAWIPAGRREQVAARRQPRTTRGAAGFRGWGTRVRWVSWVGRGLVFVRLVCCRGILAWGVRLSLWEAAGGDSADLPTLSTHRAAPIRTHRAARIRSRISMSVCVRARCACGYCGGRTPDCSCFVLWIRLASIRDESMWRWTRVLQRESVCVSRAARQDTQTTPHTNTILYRTIIIARTATKRPGGA